MTGYIESVRLRQPKFLLAVAFVIAIAAAFVFGYRVGWHASHMRWATEPIRPWMSVPFIAHTHHVPAERLFSAIGVQPHPEDRRPLRRIARDESRPVADLIRDLEDTLVKLRGARSERCARPARCSRSGRPRSVSAR